MKTLSKAVKKIDMIIKVQFLIIFSHIANFAYANGLKGVIDEQTDKVKMISKPIYVLIVVVAGLSIPIARRFGLNVLSGVALGLLVIAIAVPAVNYFG